MQHKQNTLYIKFCIPQIQILQHVKFTVRDARGQWHKKRSCFHDGQNISKNYILGGKAEGRGEGSMAGGGGGPMSGLHCVRSTEHLRDRLWIPSSDILKLWKYHKVGRVIGCSQSLLFIATNRWWFKSLMYNYCNGGKPNSRNTKLQQVSARGLGSWDWGMFGAGLLAEHRHQHTTTTRHGTHV